MIQLTLTLCTCPDFKTAESLARLLVENKHAACVNILPGITSIYSWKNQIESSEETLLIIKSIAENYQTIENTIRSHHPYETPEIIAFPVERALPEYLNWINTCHD